MQNHPRTGGWLINVGCRWNAGKNRAPAPPARVYARSDFREIRGFLRIILPPLHAALSLSLRGKKATARARENQRPLFDSAMQIAQRGRLRPAFGASELENPAERKKKKGKRGGKKKRRKRKRKQKRWFARPLASGWTAYAYEEHKGGREGKLNVRKKVANVVKIRDRQSGALCPAGEQYRRRSGDWRIFLRIGRYCWIFQIVFLAYAAAEIARNPFARLSILLLSILRFIAIYRS